MAFVTGLLLLDAPASALNNAGIKRGTQADQHVAVKKILARNPGYAYPYVSAQAVRYWLRTYLEQEVKDWKFSPVYKEDENVVYSAADPIEYWDDDLFGYMRAPKKSSLEKRKKDPEFGKLTAVEIEGKAEKAKEVTLTRISPFRVSTLVALAPVPIVNDFATATRHSGDPVLYEQEFYRATLKGLFSLNLSTAGTFFDVRRTGYRNVDSIRIQKLKDGNVKKTEVHGQSAYRLSLAKRASRVSALVRALGELQGGAKLTLHYTDVLPPVIFAAVVRGGNHPFSRIIRATDRGEPELVLEALKEVLRVYRDEIVSDVFVGWSKGYLDGERERLENLTEADRHGKKIRISHPREAMASLAETLAKPEAQAWYE